MTRTKDVVLMATVSSYESMVAPGRNELKLFGELFEPVFKASSLEARRNAVAALSRCPVVPRPVAWFLGCQPIELAALFLTSSKAIDDDTLIAIARTQGPAHAKAIAGRDNLSVKVVDALVALHDGHDSEHRPVAEPARLELDAPPLAAEEAVRQRLKDLVKRDSIVRSIESPDKLDAIRAALLVRFARLREARHFSSTLSDTLHASRWLSDRILMDVSGLQLATALVAIGLGREDGEFILCQFYPHLKEMSGDLSRAAALWSGLDELDCEDRVHAWVRADGYTRGVVAEDDKPANANETLAPARRANPARSRAGARAR